MVSCGTCSAVAQHHGFGIVPMHSAVSAVTDTASPPRAKPRPRTSKTGPHSSDGISRVTGARGGGGVNYGNGPSGAEPEPVGTAPNTKISPFESANIFDCRLISSRSALRPQQSCFQGG